MKLAAKRFTGVAVFLLLATYVWIYCNARLSATLRLHLTYSNTPNNPSYEKSNTSEKTSFGNISQSVKQSSKLIPAGVSLTSSVIAGVGGNTSLPESMKLRNVFYNRIGKCGSRSLLEVVRVIANLNKFSIASSKNYSNPHPEPRFVGAEIEKIAKLKSPTFYDRHIHYLDFEKYGFEAPIYINMMRDPISRFASHYNFKKYGDEAGALKTLEDGMGNITDCVMKDHPYCQSKRVMMFYMGSYFCGFDPVCKDRSSRKRVKLCKKNIDEKFLVVGMLEDFENTLKLLEKVLPNYFTGAADAWKKLESEMKDQTKTKTHDFLSSEAKKKLRRNHMVHEYEVYEYAKAKYEKMKKAYGIA